MTDWLEQETDRRYHDISGLFPLMDGTEFDEMKWDVANNGLLEAIWLHPDGRIIDGRNRHRACIETGTEPRFRTWSGSGSLVSFVISLNLHRRHLTSSQRAVVAQDVLPILEKEALERMKAGVAPDPAEIFPQGLGEAREQAAEMFQTNPRYVSDAKKLAEQAPDLLDDVRSGNLTIPKANRELRKREFAKKEPTPFPTGTYGVIYADPPWSYSNSGFIQSAASQYPTMTTDQICDLPVADLCSADSVLFLWITSPLLDQAFRVIRDWGFNYKASMIWDKGRAPGIGWFVATEHELLLIATRENNTHPKHKPRSVITESPGGHSEKPGLFYEVIEAMYSGPYCELFARKKIDGWDRWGNEC